MPIGDHGSLSTDALNSFLLENILIATRASVPTTKKGSTRTPNNPWWSDACGEAVKNKRYYYKKYRRNCTPLAHEEMTKAQIQSNFFFFIAQAKLAHWNNFVGNLDDRVDLGNVYKEIKKMKQLYCPPDFDLRAGDRVFKTSQAPAVNCPFTRAELETALSSVTKLKVCEGVDRVSYRMLRELPEPYMEALPALFRRCWEGGVIPDGWKHAIVTPIPKQGKSRKEVGNYRPVSLTSHIVKIYERIVKQRLNHFRESKGVIPLCQAGFRTGRGVSDHLVRLGAHVRRARLRRRALYSCFFDVRRAYDTVWHGRLLRKIKEVGLSGQMYNFVKAFLSKRTFQVRWKGTLSNSQRSDMGVPQGSVIAPLLFSVMLYDINKIQKHDAIITLYADDLAIWKESKCRKFTDITKTNSFLRQIQKQFQEIINTVNQYMFQNGFSLSVEKTVFVIFGPWHPVSPEFSIIINGQRL